MTSPGAQTPSAGNVVEVSGLLAPEFAANLALMLETLAEMDQQFGRMGDLRAQLDSVIEAVRE